MDDVNYHLENWYFKPIKKMGKKSILCCMENTITNQLKTSTNKDKRTFPSRERVKGWNCVLSLKNDLNWSSSIFPF